MKLRVILIVFKVFMLYCGVIDCHEHIKYAAVLFRHGDRTPVDPYPTDPYKNETLWPVKFGQLTNTGKAQHFKLGQWAQARYKSLVNSTDEYDPTQMRVRSTDVDRTLMSAQAFLAGMFPPIGKAIWNPTFMWQPIPIHTVPEEDDELLSMKKYCHNYNLERNRYKNSAEYKKRLSCYKNLMNYLSLKAGKKVRDYEDINSIYSVLKIEKLYNFTLPAWTTSVFPDQMIKPSGYSFGVDTATPLLARLRIGPFLKEVTQNMLKIMHTHNSKQPYHNVKYDDLDGVPPFKMNIYSAHDLNIGNVLSGLGLFDGKCPQYTATIFMELIYDDTAHIHFVRISYRNTVDIVEPEVLSIPGCGNRCPLERFIKIYDDLIPSDWKAECGHELPVDKILMYSLNFIVLVGIFAFSYQIRITAESRRRLRVLYAVVPNASAAAAAKP